MDKRKIIVSVGIILLILVGVFIAFMSLGGDGDVEETGYVLYTDGPDENGDGMIDGEVFFVDSDDLP